MTLGERQSRVEHFAEETNILPLLEFLPCLYRLVLITIIFSTDTLQRMAVTVQFHLKSKVSNTSQHVLYQLSIHLQNIAPEINF